MSEVLAFMPDGYTEEAVIHTVPLLYPQVCFSYRPVLVEERADYYKAADKVSGMQLRLLAANYLASHLKSWDVKDDKGAVVKIDAPNLLRIKDGLFNRLFSVIFTDEAPDARPSVSDQEKQTDLADVMKAAETGRTVAQVRQEREQKN